MAQPKGPFRLVTVNTAPQRAKLLVGRVVEALKNDYTIDHMANCESIDQVESVVRECNPDILVTLPGRNAPTTDLEQFSASMWSPEEATKIHGIARSIVPGIKLHAIPQGLQVERGPDAVVEHLNQEVPKLLG